MNFKSLCISCSFNFPRSLFTQKLVLMSKIKQKFLKYSLWFETHKIHSCLTSSAVNSLTVVGCGLICYKELLLTIICRVWLCEDQCVSMYLHLQVNADDCVRHLSHHQALASAKKGKKKSHIPLIHLFELFVLQLSWPSLVYSILPLPLLLLSVVSFCGKCDSLFFLLHHKPYNGIHPRTARKTAAREQDNHRQYEYEAFVWFCQIVLSLLPGLLIVTSVTQCSTDSTDWSIWTFFFIWWQ